MLIFIISCLFTIGFFSIEFLYFRQIILENIFILYLGSFELNLPSKNPVLWENIKLIFLIFTFLANLIIFNYLIEQLLSVFKHPSHHISKYPLSDSINLVIGQKHDSLEKVVIPEKGLFQNILITGAIGSGKTSSAMYPITEQLLAYKSDSKNSKLGMLILDVKGNYYQQVIEFTKKYKREDDLIPIQISGHFKYNPLDNLSLKPSVLANRLKTILLLFSPNNTESYWIDKSETVLSEAIKLCRLYNNNYVTFLELHNLITNKDYYLSKVSLLREKFLKNKFNKLETYDLLSSINFFEKEFFSLDDRTMNILKSEITRITNCFVSDAEVSSTFCPNKSEINFNGFEDVIKSGKIVVLNMNINEYRNLSKIIAAYLKLDFQTEVLKQLSNVTNNSLLKPVVFISDEYSEYVSATDANFFSQSRESKCINIVSTQSYTSLLNALNNKYSVEVIVQNLVNKLWFRSDDTFTIEDAQKQLRKSRQRKIF